MVLVDLSGGEVDDVIAAIETVQQERGDQDDEYGRNLDSARKKLYKASGGSI